MTEEVGRKNDTKKPRWGLIPYEALNELVKLYTLGSVKYAPWNWSKGLSYERVFNALNRHLWAWWGGETHDPEDGQHHLIAVAWGAFTLFMFELKGCGTDDRHKY